MPRSGVQVSPSPLRSLHAESLDLGAGELIGLLIFDPIGLLVAVVLFGGGSAFLWGEGVAYALRRLPGA